MEFKDTLHSRRLELGLSLTDIADYVGVSAATVSRWERGEIQNLRRDKIAKLAEVLKMSPSALMGWTSDSTSSLTPDIYLRLAQGAKQMDLSEQDIKTLLEIARTLKERDKNK